MSDFRQLVRKAVQIAGSQRKLAELVGCSQTYISYLLVRAQTREAIGAKNAIGIERATGGQITREQLRPDLFGTKVA